MEDAIRLQGREFGFWQELEAKLRRNPSLRPARRAFRRAKRWLPNWWRMTTERYRALPSALIIGAQKAGTTQLHLCLTRHPRCFSAVKKELHYFTKHRDRPLAWYRSQFPLTGTVSQVDGVCLESTPSYLPAPLALEMMSQMLPKAKLIVVLRDPVKRAFSHYQHYKSRSLESRDFAAVVEEALADQSYAAVLGGAHRTSAAPLLHYVHRGYYALQLETLFDRFPREQVLVLDSANLFDDTNVVCQEVFDFLGLEHHDVSPKKIHNRGLYRETIDPEVARALREHYRPHDELLAGLLERRFRWMDEPSAAPAQDRNAA